MYFHLYLLSVLLQAMCQDMLDLFTTTKFINSI